MGFATALSGLNAASTDLQVLGNNIANANTVGFKASSTLFADVFAAASGLVSGGSQAGLGVQVAAISPNFAQGTIQSSANPLYLAINGGGMFRLVTGTGTAYSRNGQFHLDNNGYIVNANGAQLSGYLANNGVVSGTLGPLQIPIGQIAPQATAQVGANLNLQASATAINTTTYPFSSSDPNSYNYSTSMTVYDSLGTSHLLTLYFTKVQGSGGTGAPDKWNVNWQVDNGAGGNTPSGGTLLTGLTFDSSGRPTGTTTGSTGTINWGDGAAAGAVAVNFASSRLFDQPFAVNNLTIDGNAAGALSGISIGSDGIVQGNYSNGQSQTLGQVALANFRSLTGLTPLGNNLFGATINSGPPLLGTPGAGALGTIKASATESSNVDLTQSLVNLITAQQTYQANAKTIKTENQILQMILSLS